MRIKPQRGAVKKSPEIDPVALKINEPWVMEVIVTVAPFFTMVVPAPLILPRVRTPPFTWHVAVLDIAEAGEI